MAKGKKSSGVSKTSKGERRSSMKTASGWTAADRMLFKMDALKKGKDVVFTMANPNKEETNRPFIKVRVNGREYLKKLAGGDHKRRDNAAGGDL